MGGGCHWCTEGVFQSFKGVTQVDQGWIASTGDHETLSEGVIVHFDPDKISLETLIEIHLLTHASSSDHSMRGKYRSAIYFYSEFQFARASETLEAKIKDDDSIITKVLPFGKFELNREDQLNYYRTRPDAPFCQRYISPKLERLMTSHGMFLKEQTPPPASK